MHWTATDELIEVELSFKCLAVITWRKKLGKIGICTKLYLHENISTGTLFDLVEE